MLRHYHPPNLSIMTITEQRSHAVELLDKVDDDFLAAVYAMLETYVRLKEDPIVGYEADGTAVRASVALEQFEEDLSKPEEFVSLEDFKEQLNTRSAA
jgi:hypothetical protein